MQDAIRPACNNCFEKSHICDGKQATCGPCQTEGVMCETTWDVSYVERSISDAQIYEVDFKLKRHEPFNLYSEGLLTDNYRVKSAKDNSLSFVKIPRLLKQVTKLRIAQLCSREYVTWSRLSHTNILPFMCSPHNQLEVDVIEPWMEHGNVLDYVRTVSDIDRILLMRQILHGVCYLHEQCPALVHGNPKPSNILIRSDGTPVISDFGMSYVAEESEILYPSEDDGLQMLNVRWFPPERLRGPTKNVLNGHLRVTEVDIFVLCRTFYSILTNGVPYDGVGSVEIALRVFNGQSPDRYVKGASLHMTDDTWAYLEKGWSTEPSQRPTAKAIPGYLIPPSTFVPS